MSNTPGKGGLLAAGLGWGLAFGIALGALVLAPAIPGASSTGSTAPAAGGDEVRNAQQHAEMANELLAQESATIVKGRLSDVPVSILRTSSASDDDVDSVRWLLNAAGASDSGTLTLTEKFTDQQSADELSSVIANTLPAGAQLSVENRSPGTHAGESLGSVLISGADGQAAAQSEDRQLVLETLQQAGFIEYSGSVVPAGAVVIVHGGSDSAGGSFGEQVVRELAAALGEKGSTVFATQDLSPEAISGVPTVGGVDAESGRIATVLAAS